jgi:hypothetical protein
MLHLVCGDLAGEVLRKALGPQARIRVLRDDLAVGPLRDIESPPCAARVAFWEQVWPAQLPGRPDFAGELTGDAGWLAQLDEAVTLWHGDSCSEQLLLTRVAASLDQSGAPLWEVACGQLPTGPRRTVSLCSPTQLASLYQQARALDGERRRALAAIWREQCHLNAEIRLWQDGRFVSQGFAELDQALLDACGRHGQLAEAMGQVMAGTRGFFPTDLLLFWRARELQARGLLRLAGEPGAYGYRDLRVTPSRG